MARTRGRAARATSSSSTTDFETLPPGLLARRIGWIALLGVWLFLTASLVSFDAADPPSHAAAPFNDPVANWCGPVGAMIAYHSFLVFGSGMWVIMLGLAAYLGVTASGRVVGHPVVRFFGIVFMATAFASMQGLLFPNAGPMPSIEGGLLSTYLVTELTLRFSTLGSFLFLFAAFGVGGIVAADEIMLSLPKVIYRGATAIAHIRLPAFPKVSLPSISLPRFSLPKWKRRQPRLATDVGEVDVESISAAETSSSRRRKRHRRAKNEEVHIDADAGGVGAVEAFDPDEHELTDEDEDESVAEEASDESSSSQREKLSRDELRAKIAKLPVKMAGKTPTVARDEDIPRQENFEGYQFPTLDLLEDPESNFSEKMEKFVREQAEVLEEALQTYGIDGEVKGIDAGPSVTLYAVQLAPGTKVAKVSSISSDLARSLRAQNIRIVPNMTGTSAIGIEVPNLHKEKVRLKELMSGGHAERMVLPMFLGKDSSGEPLVADLTRMPHMLIAGTTGSGKSVCINTIIMSWLYTKRPDELKLVLVDPKMVELSMFSDIPHLMCPVVTEMGKAAAILEWAVNKMEERYELLKEAMVRDIAGYNQLTEEELFERFAPQNDVEKAKIPRKLPYMVFVVDELADLIMTHKEVEHSIVRIAQKARAVGIHLILATQRPQANVVTGLIKSNMPCRASFKVSSGMDSRIVLDQKGAELLLGQGDMLFLTPHSHELSRAQGTLVTDAETRKVTKFMRDIARPTFERQLMTIRPAGADEGGDGEAGSNPAERDPLFDSAVRIMIETGRGSVSLLQRRLAIGYSRASRLVDQMGLAGILGDHKGSVAREVLISLEEWEEMKRLEEQQEASGTLFGESDEEVDDDEGHERTPFVETFAGGSDDDDEDGAVPAEFEDEYRR